MKICIWCKGTELQKSFKNEAHTIPKTLGNSYICKNVCDECNSYFGNHFNGLPSVEAAIKETFMLSKARLSRQMVLRNNKHFTSEYFKVDFIKNKISLKLKYSTKPGFQEGISRQLRKGIYKMFLEENERINGNSLDSKFDFIRQFSRFNFGDYPLFYFIKSAAIVLMADDFIKFPTIMLMEKTHNYLLQDCGFHEFEFFGHVFSITTTQYWELFFPIYIKQSKKLKKDFFKSCIRVERWNQIDFAMEMFNS